MTDREISLDEIRDRAAARAASQPQTVAEQVAEVARLVGRVTDDLRTAEIEAAQVAEIIASFAPKVRHAMTVGRVRCPGGRVLLRAYRLPAHDPMARRSPFLAVPVSGAHHRHDDGTVAAAPWWLVPGSMEVWDLRCRCHAAWRRVDVPTLLGVADPDATGR